MRSIRALSEAYRLPEEVGEYLYPGINEAYISRAGGLGTPITAVRTGTHQFTVQQAERFEYEGRPAVRVAVCDDYTNVVTKSESGNWSLNSASATFGWYIVTPPAGLVGDPLESTPAASASQTRERYPTWDVFDGYHVEMSGLPDVGVSTDEHRALIDECHSLTVPQVVTTKERPPGTWYPGWLRPEGA